MSKKEIIFVMIGSFIYATTVTAFLFIVVRLNSMLEEKNKILLQEESDKAHCIYKRDSLIREVKNLKIYESLTKAMVHRDEATKLLKQQVGDIVLLKRDSSQVVISDIIIGGSNHFYYIKYRVMHSDNTTEEVIPELIYVSKHIKND